MTNLIGIKYEEEGNVVLVTTEQSYQKNDLVVINNKKGSRLAQVVAEKIEIDEAHLPTGLDSVKRLATSMDCKAYEANLVEARESAPQVERLIAANGLKMKLVNIVFPLDRSFVLITFSAEERVDFRQLLRDLASYFRTRIELHQINSREEAKIYGGLGLCGRPLCCSTFLGEFPPVSIKMVKNQGLSLNSGKTSGLCGRLLCCLSFEDHFYQESKEKFPDVGAQVQTKDGQGVVRSIDVFSETLKIQLEDKTTPLVYALEEVLING